MNLELANRDELLKLLHQNLGRAQKRMKSIADKHKTIISYSPGDRVFVRLNPYKQLSLTKNIGHKLSKRYYGLYVISKRIGETAFELQFPSYSRIHNVLHVSLLKKAYGILIQHWILLTIVFNDVLYLHLWVFLVQGSLSDKVPLSHKY